MTDSSKMATAKEMANTSSDMPPEIADYLVEIALQDRAAAYLQVTAEGHLASSGGQLQKYGLAAIAQGDYIGDVFYYLEGFFPLEQTEMMQHLQLDSGPVVDVHVLTDSQRQGAGWVLLLDTTAEAQRAQRLQQKGNDLSLLRQQYAKLLNQNLTPSQQQKEAVNLVHQTETAPQTLSVLIVKFCGPGADQLSIGKPTTLKAINASLSFITQVIVEEGGLINHVLGGTAAAFFGLLPSQQAAPQQALYAAERILKRLMKYPPSYALSPLSAEALAAEGESASQQSKRLGIGASITSGEAAAGILNGQGGERINAVGDPIESAAQLESYIQPGTITLDGDTFGAVRDRQIDFQSWNVSVMPASEMPQVAAVKTTLYRRKF